MIKLGGPVFSADDDPKMLAKAHKAKGYTAAYVPPVSVGDKPRLKEIREAFKAEDIILAEVGYWGNITDTDDDERKKNINELTDALFIAEEVGAVCAIDIFGSYIHGHGTSAFTKKNFSNDAFDDAVDIARLLIDTVKPKTAFFAYEIFQFNIVDSPETIEKLIKAVDRKQFGAHLDLANLINCPRAYYSSGEIMRDCIKRFGNKIVAAHIKDVKMKEPALSVSFEEVIPGEGNLDIKTFISEIHKLPRDIPFMMEHLSSKEEYDKSAAHIRKCAFEEGIIL